MTTGEKLLEMSTLSTGTALDHFLNIRSGGGVTAGAVSLDMIDVPIVADVALEREAFAVYEESIGLDIEDVVFEADMEQEEL